MIEHVQWRRGQRLVLAGVVASLLGALTTWAQAESSRVLLRVPAVSDPVLEEAVIRVRGELSAMGLSAEIITDQLPDGAATAVAEPARGTLTFERDSGWVRIRATGARSNTPVLQELDARRSEITAEVVAVRAVEALRAVVTGLAPLTPPAPAAKPPPAKPAPARTSSSAQSPLIDPGSFSVWAAPSLLHDFGQKGAGVGAELGVTYGYWLCFAGVQANTTLYRASLNVAEGSVDVGRSALLGRAGCALPLAPQLGLFASLGAGLAHYAVDGRAVTGYRAESPRHDSAIWQLGVGGVAWFSRHVGGYARVDASLASSAPTVRVANREVLLLERPLGWAALGVVARLP